MPKAGTARKKLLIDKEYLSEALHVALRKACDSKPTSLMWNLIYLADGEEWELYLDHVYVQLIVACTKDEPLPLALKAASLSFSNALHASRRTQKINHHVVTCWDITFEMMSTADWEGYAAYLLREA
jgi:hypothetical protein